MNLRSHATKCGWLPVALPLGLLLACGGDDSGPPEEAPQASLVYQEVSGEVGRIVQVKADGSERVVRWEGRSNFGALSVAPDGSGLRRVTSNGDFTEAAYWSADDHTLITVGAGLYALSSVDAASGAQRALGQPWPKTNPWSPDNEFILYAASTNGIRMSRIGVARADGRNPRLVTPDSVSVTGVAWLPDAE